MVRQTTQKKLLEIARDVDKEFPSIVRRGADLRTAREERRLSWGYNIHADRADFVLRSIKTGGTAADWARSYIAKNGENLRKRFDIDIRHEIVGPARVPVANLSTNEYPACRAALEGALRPGSSIGNEFGGAGSIGLVVVVEPKSEEPFLAVTTAAHVLALTNEMRKHKEVASPAQSDSEEPKASDVIGEYHDGTLLVRQIEGAAAATRGNRSDVAIVRISDEVLSRQSRTIARFNQVPHPDDPSNQDRSLSITEIVPGENIHDYVDETVYKVGRTTWFTEGRLELASAGNITPKMHNGNYYNYVNLAVVEFPKDKDFTQPGDSGALVYTRDGKALGFIVGVEDKTSFFCPAHTLHFHNSRLYDPRRDDF